MNHLVVHFPNLVYDYGIPFHPKEMQGMPKTLQLRPVSAEEEQQLRRLARARNAPAAVVQRARVIVYMLDHPGVSAKAAGQAAGFRWTRGQYWVKRFNREGIAGLLDRPRSGRPRQYDETVRGEVIRLARTRPQALGYPFALWTVRRLQQAIAERLGVHLAPSTIWKWLRAEGLRWKQQQSWFTVDRQDPEFVRKRGR